MPTKKPMTTITIDDDIFERIEDFRFNNRFANRSAAINFLIKAGMQALSDKYPELKLITQFEAEENQQDNVTPTVSKTI